MVYDQIARATILFGGVVYDDEDWHLQSDTWELRDEQWSPVDVSAPPRARHRGAMVFDEHRGVSVLFGGQADDGSLLGDTWLFANRRWRRRRPWSWRRPEPRCGHALAYDEPSGLVVLFGGVGSGDRALGDTWVFNGSSWRLVGGPQPPARRYAAFAYNPTMGGCLLHGGSSDDRGAVQFGECWLFREGTWTKMPRGFETDVRDDHGLGYHRSAKMMVMLEGVGGSRGILTSSLSGWKPATCHPLHPRHQCSPMAWDPGLHGLVIHGGEAYHEGPQSATTLVLRQSSTI
ncbi:Kelch repeat-containing protein [Singulisphaera rosea]